jgi:hypothetical protein
VSPKAREEREIKRRHVSVFINWILRGVVVALGLFELFTKGV